MKILPSTTLPSKAPFSRSHSPRPAEHKGGYRVYRDCLRWEFGFTCALCLLHEADLEEYGVDVSRSAKTWIEHIVPQSDDPDKVNVYENCLYACCYCNRARSTKPTQDEKGNRLLDPTSSAWAEHFDAVDDKLVPKTGDGEYTRICYELNDELKVLMRGNRRTQIEKLNKQLREYPAEIEQDVVLAKYLSASNDPRHLEAAEALFRAVVELEEKIQIARTALERYRGIPNHHPTVCRCRRELKLPPQLADQLIEV